MDPAELDRLKGLLAGLREVGAGQGLTLRPTGRKLPCKPSNGTAGETRCRKATGPRAPPDRRAAEGWLGWVFGVSPLLEGRNVMRYDWTKGQ